MKICKATRPIAIALPVLAGCGDDGTMPTFPAARTLESDPEPAALRSPLEAR